MLQVVVEASKFSRVELRKPKALVHEKKGCDEGQTAIKQKYSLQSTIIKYHYWQFTLAVKGIYIYIYLTSSGIGCKFSFTYPTEGGISALLFPKSRRKSKCQKRIITMIRLLMLLTCYCCSYTK